MDKLDQEVRRQLMRGENRGKIIAGLAHQIAQLMEAEAILIIDGNEDGGCTDLFIGRSSQAVKVKGMSGDQYTLMEKGYV